MEKVIREYIQKNQEELLFLLKELCRIPAPSHKEHKRAEFCKHWLDAAGAQGVYIDEVLNVVAPFNCDGSDALTVYVAHTDTVFSDMEPMPMEEDDAYLRCPGVGDDTASLAVMLMTIKFVVERKIQFSKGALFVCNSCEEGLGNLKGTRQLFRDYEGRIAKFISFDSKLEHVADRCVGSHRYEVEALTEGGHSFSAFGNENAIHVLAKVICQIYQIQPLVRENCKTTYNVGIVSGGTSINTIAQNAKILCEYRSDDLECLRYMQGQFQHIFDENQSDLVQLKVRIVGERPCGNTDQEKMAQLKAQVLPVIEGVIGKQVLLRASSTDCNIPLSMGIPALCVGVYRGGGSHTREEWVEKSSLPIGLEVAIKIVLKLGEI